VLTRNAAITRLRLEQTNRENATSEFYRIQVDKESQKAFVVRGWVVLFLVLLFGICGVSVGLTLSVAVSVCLFLGYMECYERNGTLEETHNKG
jgi:hypothetical protein